MNAQKPQDSRTLTAGESQADNHPQAIDLFVDGHCWATLSRDSDGVSLSVAQCRDGKPWRIGADSLEQTLASARKLLGA